MSVRDCYEEKSNVSTNSGGVALNSSAQVQNTLCYPQSVYIHFVVLIKTVIYIILQFLIYFSFVLVLIKTVIYMIVQFLIYLSCLY